MYGAIADRQSKALSQMPDVYASIRAIAENSEQRLNFIRCKFSSVLQLQTMDIEFKTDSLLDSMWLPNACKEIVGADVVQKQMSLSTSP